MGYRGASPKRFAFGLGISAAFAHLGWGLLHWEALQRAPWAWLDPAGGYCVLFAPLGVLLVTPAAAAFRALPLALAVARVGCLAAGCCHASSGAPTPALEALGFGATHLATSRLADRWVIPAFCVGFASVRLLVEPWRSPPPLGEPALSPAWIALVWWIGGGAWAARLAWDQKRKPYWKP